MKMSETKPGDIIKFSPSKNDDAICVVLSGPFCDFQGDPHDWPKLIILWESTPNPTAGEWYNQYQYNKVFNNYDVTLLKLGIKE